MNFSKIQYPKCPECKVLINNLKIFDLIDLSSPNGTFRVKVCPSCKADFIMCVRIELTVEVDKMSIK